MPQMDLQSLKIDREPPARTRSRRKRGWVGPVIALVVLALLAFLFQAQIRDAMDRVRLPEVRTTRVVRTNPAQAAAVSGTAANGYIVARTRAALSADTPGRIVELRVQEGSTVKKGDVVARLYSEEYAAALREAEAELALAQAGLVRAGADVEVSLRELEQARSTLRSAQAALSETAATIALAQLDFDRAEGRVEVARGSVGEAHARVDAATAVRDRARATLEKTEVRAPFDGIVVLKDAEVGEVVSPNVQGGSNARGSVVTMVDFATLEVQAEVPETNLASVVLGAPAQIYLDAWPEQPYPGRVDRIWPTANRTKATVEVRIVFLARDERLRPEMGVRVVFAERAAESAPADGAQQAPAERLIVVPENALVRTGGETQVFVLERDVARLRTVVLGESRAGKLVVRAGLVEGETIVLDPPHSLADGARVRIAP